MLLEFETTNYKSFRNTLSFSMIPAPKQKGIDYSIQNERIGKKTYKALSSAVIYGPNASGKTNIIGAMDTFRAIVLRGNINNCEMPRTPNVASCALELIPFTGLSKAEPVKFRIVFVESGMLVEYSLEMMLGLFLEQNYKRKITFEHLRVNDNDVFVRKENEFVLNIPVLSDGYLNSNDDSAVSNLEIISKSSLSDDELFLSNGFKSIVSKKLFDVVNDWFSKKFMIIYQASEIQLARRYENLDENSIYIDKTLNEAAKAFGINSNALGFKKIKSEEDSILFSLFERDETKMAVPADAFESYGTIRFVNEFPLIIRALLTGATLVIDEFDASIHPMALMNIISIFHNDDINKRHAQLIFNTHNPIFLNSNLYRRDEIKFVERDDTTHESVHYALSDFKTSGTTGVRKGEDYMKRYFVSQYGAIKDVDFSPLLEDIIASKEENTNG